MDQGRPFSISCRTPSPEPPNRAGPPARNKRRLAAPVLDGLGEMHVPVSPARPGSNLRPEILSGFAGPTAYQVPIADLTAPWTKHLGELCIWGGIRNLISAALDAPKRQPDMQQYDRIQPERFGSTIPESAATHACRQPWLSLRQHLAYGALPPARVSLYLERPTRASRSKIQTG
jgi:hypothetical protein